MLLVNNVQPEKYAQFLSSQIHKSHFNQVILVNHLKHSEVGRLMSLTVNCLDKKAEIQGSLFYS